MLYKKGLFEHITLLLEVEGTVQEQLFFVWTSWTKLVKWDHQEWKRMILHGVIAILHPDVV
ncbi:hypothetical protein HNO89_001058 [Sporosarcina luteola]|nr:hypothetical protein [Sporosarcina luteola]